MEERIITFSANQQSLIKTGGISHYASDTVSYIKAIFDLGENWTGLDEVRAVFKTPYDTRVAVLNSLGECEVPHEILMLKAEVRVNLVGSIYIEEAVVDRLTTYSCEALEVDEDVPVEGGGTVTPSPSEYEQFVAKVKEDADRAETSATDADASAQASEQSADNSARSAQASATFAQSAHDDKIAIEEAIAEVIQQIEDFEQVQVVVNTLPPSSQATSDFTDGVLTLGIPQGVKGDTGNGIQSITKTGTSGLVDTYTITFTDGQTTTFTVTNGAKGDTGNGISSIEKTSTEGLVDTYTITYTDGTTSIFTVTNGEKGDKGGTGEVSLQELEQATVVQTLSDSTPYNYRRTNNGQGSGHREYDEIVGASVGWNQLVDSSSTSVTVQSGHKYYANIGGTKTVALSNGSAISVSGGADNVVDLTLMNSAIADYVYSLEQSTAGSGVAWLKTHFPKLFDNGYQPFDSGSIKSVSGLTAHEMVGVNLLNTATETSGTKLNNDGTTTSASNSKVSDYIRVFGGESYYFIDVKGSNSGVGLCEYDASKSFVAYQTFYGSGKKSGVKTLNASTVYIRVSYYDDSTQIAVMRSSTALPYEPYESHTYPLDSSVELRGKYYLDSNNQLRAMGDVYKADGSVTRNWSPYTCTGNESIITQQTLANNKWVSFTLPNAKSLSGVFSPDFVTDMAVTYCNSINTDVAYGAFRRSAYFYISFPVSMSSTDIKAWISGKTVVYELKTPTTETAEPYTSPQWCDSHGTEEYVGSELPVGHNTQYPMTLIDTADGLSNGTYEPRITVANGKKTVTWQSV